MSDKKTLSPLKRKWIKRIIVISILLIIFVAGYLSWNFSRKLKAEQLLLKDTTTVITGDISTTVQAGGTITYADSIQLDAPANGTVEEIFIESGDFVKKGDDILSIRNDRIDDEILALENEIQSLDISIISESSRKTSSVYSPVSGKIKGIFVQKGDDLSAVSSTLDGILLISVDDRMVVHIPVGTSVSVNDKVTVHIGNKTAEGTVVTIGSEEIEITFDDHSYAIGETATVCDSGGNELGKGPVEVHTPYYVISKTGIVSSVPVSIDQKVSVGTTLLRLKEAVHSQRYLDLLNARQDVVDKLSRKRTEPELVVLSAPEDGIITEILAVSGSEIVEDQTVATMSFASDLELIIHVDELNIPDISIGLACKIYYMALEGETYSGTVVRISQSVSGADGFSRYPVNVKLNETDEIKAGMSARVEILTAERSGTLLIPSEAIQIIDGKRYVLVTESADENGKTPDPGREVEITVGLSNGLMTEVLSGLKEGDIIIIPSEEESFSRFFFG